MLMLSAIYADNRHKFRQLTFHIVVIVRVQYYSPDELNRRYEKTSSIGSKRVVSRTYNVISNNVIM